MSGNRPAQQNASWSKVSRAINGWSNAPSVCKMKHSPEAEPGTLPPSFALLLRYQTTNERAFYRAHKTLEDGRKAAQQFVSQNEEKAHKAQESAALAFLTKPFPPLDLEKHLARVRAERDQKATAAKVE